ncbi:MAG: lytic transglycosylase domain-containing protein [Actinobacteria bacterium]|nr:MAG: lytic transglycosylase domain-containing protein [Actinomycetota bacterium]
MARFTKKIPFIIPFIIILLLVIASTIGYNYWLHLSYPLKYEKQIINETKKNKLNPYLICAIIREESRFNPHSVSSKGAVGLMQIMPQTAFWISKKTSYPIKSAADLMDSSLNIKMGTWYFAYLYNRYQSEDAALIAYNGGTANVERWHKSTDDINVLFRLFAYKESKQYLAKVKKSVSTYKWLYPDAF